MRKLYLENEYGQRYDFQKKGVCLLNNLNGFGSEYNNTYSQAGECFLLDSSFKSQKTPTGTVNFFGDCYKNFFEFSKFVKSYNNYKLVYIVNDTEYFLDVDLKYLDKGEIDENGILSCPICFLAKSNYYKKISNNFSVETLQNDNKWPLKFPYTFNDNITSSIDVKNDGQCPASFNFTIYGYAENPSVEIWKNNILVSCIEFHITIEKNEKLIYSNKDNDLYVQKVLSNGDIVNIVDCLNPLNNNFEKLPIGNSTLVFKHEISKIDFSFLIEMDCV